MVHIILLILKIIGCFILALIGLLILAIAVILFAPVGYRFDLTAGERKEEILGRLRFYWMRPIFSGEVCYEKGNLKWYIRAAWKKIPIAEDSSVGGEHLSERRADAGERTVPKESRSEEKRELLEKSTTVDESSGLKEKEDREKEDTKRRELSGKRRKENRSNRSFEKFVKKMEYTFQKMCDNIKALAKKKEAAEQFLKDEIHKNAFFKTMKELKRFLQSLCPKKFDVRAEFGFEDPAITGYILAAISMVYPFFGEHVSIKPDFEEKKLDLDMHIEGKIRVFHLFLFAVHMFLDKNVRTTITHIRKLKR